MMKKMLIALLCSLLLLTSVSCENNHGNKQPKPSQTATIPSETIATPSETKPLPTQAATVQPKATEAISPDLATTEPDAETTEPEATALPPKEIPTNASVNVAWGGDMCEANGFIYYVSDKDGKESVTRMKQDGSDITKITTGDYSELDELTSDKDYLYFVSSTDKSDMIYRIPLKGGKEQKIAKGSVYELQGANGKLYWLETDLDGNGDATSSSIKCMNSDGSNIRSLYTFQYTAIDMACFELLVSEGNIYYATGIMDGEDNIDCDIYRMDLDGRNIVKLNAKKVNWIDRLFFDQNCLYLLTETIDDGLYDSLQTLDSKGNIVTLLDNVGFFPQDEDASQFCGISNHIFYHITDDLNFCQFDLDSGKDTIIPTNDYMNYGTLYSIRGKAIKNLGVIGLYIVGNDIYYSPCEPY